MPDPTQPAVRLLFLADTHLGFDTPLRPRVQRRRRGDDFLKNYLAALQPAFDKRVDIVLHGGDLFFRSRVHPLIVETAFAPLLRIADLGIPVFIVPGNHERSNIPRSLLETHPNIRIFDRPATHVLSISGYRLALSGFPNVRHQSGPAFRQELEKTGWQAHAADLRLLCMHQAVEGARVGVQNYTFRAGAEVIRGRDIPAGFAAVLSGHIHRHQVLRRDLAGRDLNAAVFYPGSTERTSFAEREETKGYLLLTFTPHQPPGHEFVPLPARPMIDLAIDCQGLSPDQVQAQLLRQIGRLDANAIVRVHLSNGNPQLLFRGVNDRWLRTVAPASMNISCSQTWPGRGEYALPE